MNSKTEGADKLRDLVVDALEERKAIDISVLDVRAMTTITDYMIIASGTSDRHVKSVADFLVEHLREHKIRAKGIEGAEQGEWVLVDFADVIVHVMQVKTREFYNLEKLWSFGASDSNAGDRV